jgi:hypothetical protein
MRNGKRLCPQASALMQINWYHLKTKLAWRFEHLSGVAGAIVLGDLSV